MFINETGIIAQLLANMDVTVTGSFYLSVFLLMIFLILIGIIFRLPVQLLALLTTPLAVVLMSSRSEFMVIGVVVLLIDGFILAIALQDLIGG